jgi:hypothetical protein
MVYSVNINAKKRQEKHKKRKTDLKRDYRLAALPIHNQREKKRRYLRPAHSVIEYAASVVGLGVKRKQHYEHRVCQRYNSKAGQVMPVDLVSAVREFFFRKIIVTQLV